MSNFDETLMKRLTKLEREVERLKVKESPIMSNYLLTTGKAADSDKLDGLDSTDFGRPVFLVTPLTSTSWDGDSFSTTSKTLIDLSSVFGAPAGIKAVDVLVNLRDSASATTYSYMYLSPNNTANSGKIFSCDNGKNDGLVPVSATIPCNSDGDIYYQIIASGSGTMDVTMQIWGYWL